MAKQPNNLSSHHPASTDRSQVTEPGIVQNGIAVASVALAVGVIMYFLFDALPSIKDLWPSAVKILCASALLMWLLQRARIKKALGAETAIQWILSVLFVPMVVFMFTAGREDVREKEQTNNERLAAAKQFAVVFSELRAALIEFASDCVARALAEEHQVQKGPDRRRSVPVSVLVSDACRTTQHRIVDSWVSATWVVPMHISRTLASEQCKNDGPEALKAACKRLKPYLMEQSSQMFQNFVAAYTRWAAGKGPVEDLVCETQALFKETHKLGCILMAAAYSTSGSLVTMPMEYCDRFLQSDPLAEPIDFPKFLLVECKGQVFPLQGANSQRSYRIAVPYP